MLFCSFTQHHKLLQNRNIKLKMSHHLKYPREIKTFIWVPCMKYQKYLNCQLYTAAFSYGWLKIASEAWSPQWGPSFLKPHGLALKNYKELPKSRNYITWGLSTAAMAKRANTENRKIIKMLTFHSTLNKRQGRKSPSRALTVTGIEKPIFLKNYFKREDFLTLISMPKCSSVSECQNQ